MLEKEQVQQINSPSEVFQNRDIGGKFQFIGEIVSIYQQDFIDILSILSGKDVVCVIADE
jgi:hypothetical protein